jgi:DNA modification methylase
VLDPFGGTGTVALVAKALGAHGISVDMSADYCRLASWRVNDRDQLGKVLGIARPPAPVPADHPALF